MLAEAALLVMVLAMDVSGDGTADSYEPGARADWDEPTFGHADPHEPVETHPGLDDDQTDPSVEPQHPAASGHVQDPAARVLSRVTICAAEAPGEHASTAGREHGGTEVVVGSRRYHGRERRRRASPTRQRLKIGHDISAIARHPSHSTPRTCKSRSRSTISSGKPAIPPSISTA